jgi:hypothetical protein
MWTLAFGHHEDRTPTHGYAETREAAMAAFAKSWRRGWAKCERPDPRKLQTDYGQGLPQRTLLTGVVTNWQRSA